jgi:hypothetical protein
MGAAIALDNNSTLSSLELQEDLDRKENYKGGLEISVEDPGDN